MLRARVSIVVYAVFALSACQQHAREREVIGSWYYVPSIDDQLGITYRPDHTFVIWSEDGASRRDMVFGSWHIEGTQVVMDRKESVLSRQTISELHKDFAPFQRRDSLTLFGASKEPNDRRAFNYAVQRTPGCARFYVMSVCHPPLHFVASRSGPAVADLVSR